MLRNNLFVLTMTCLVLDVAVAPATLNADEPTVAYQSQFEQGKAEGWSHQELVKVEDRALPWLGEFFDERVTLQVADLPKHQFVTVSLDVGILKSWGGHRGGHHEDGPDSLRIQIDGGPTLLNATFANYDDYAQSYPDDYPYVETKGLTGVTRRGDPDLGKLPRVSEDGGASIYRLEFTFPHTDEEITLICQASLHECLPENRTKANESWIVGNVRIATHGAATVTLDDESFQRLWDELAKPDAAKGIPAMWRLAAAGEPSLKRIQAQLKPAKEDDELKRKKAAFEKLLPQLDGDSFKQRETAQEQIIALGVAVLPWVAAARREHEGNPEMRFRLDHIAEQLNKLLEKDSFDYRAARLRQLLAILGTNEAIDLRNTIPEPAKVKLQVQPPRPRPVPLPFPVPPPF